MSGRFALCATSLIGAAAALSPLPVQAQGTDCVIYATDYANSHVGSGDMTADAVSGGMVGAVAGGAWNPGSGAARGARAGAALGVLNNLGSLPGGWQGLYDMAYQLCQQQSSGANAGGYIPPGHFAPPISRCRSSASVDKPMLRTPDGGLMATSADRNCF